MIDERQMEERHCSVYVHTSPSGKYYVGMTGQDVKSRWNGGAGYNSQPYFRNAIQKYGWDNFEHEVIASHLTKEEAINFEKLLIRELKQNEREFGYNITEGGEGHTGISGEKNPMYGKHHTEEARKKIAEAGLDRPAWNKGKHHPDEVKEKMQQVWHETHNSNANSRKIRCVETGEEFQQVREAAEKSLLSTSTIAKCARKGSASRSGLHWEYVSEELKLKKPVRCIDTGVVYPSLTAAAREYGGHSNNISTALKKGYTKALGHYWEYVEED